MPLNNPMKMSHPHPSVPCPIFEAEEGFGKKKKKDEALNAPKSHWTLRAFSGTLEGTVLRNRWLAIGVRSPMADVESWTPHASHCHTTGAAQIDFCAPHFEVFVPNYPFTDAWKKPS